MKNKIFAVFVVVLICLTLTGCSLCRDKNYATLTVTTSGGHAYAARSCNGAALNSSGYEIAFANPHKIKLDDGETAYVTFKCDECEYTTTFETKKPYSDMLHCECDGEKCEYVMLIISTSATKDENTVNGNKSESSSTHS